MELKNFSNIKYRDENIEMKLYSPVTIKDIKEKFGFSLSKSLGQNFLVDKNIIDSIIERSNIGEEDLVIEIGPGIGVITRELAQAAKHVVAVELDTRLIPILEYTLEGLDNVEVINKDILKVDINQVLNEIKARGIEFEKVRVVGNLPYYITTPIIMKLLEENVPADSITVMMQKEVADRIEAKENTKARGALSVAVQYYCQVNRIVNVPKNVFVPPPKVDSTVLRLDIKKEKDIVLDDRNCFFRVVKAGFGQRRKTLLNSLSTGLSMSKEDISEVLKVCNIDEKRRAETLSMEEFGRLANIIFSRKA